MTSPRGGRSSGARFARSSSAYGDARRTRIDGPPVPVEYREEDYIVDEDAWVIVTRDGWTKRQKSFTDVASIRVRDNDRVGWVYRARARQTLTFFTDRGVAYTLRVKDLPLTSGHGEPIQKQFAFDDQEHLVGVICHDPRCLPAVVDVPQTPPTLVQATLNGEPGQAIADGAAATLPPPPYAIAMTAGGKVLRFALAPLAAVSTRKGARSSGSTRWSRATWSSASSRPTGPRPSAWPREAARVLIFPVAEANVVSGLAKGVTAIKLDPKDRVLGFRLANRMREGLTVITNRGTPQVIRATKYPVTSRGGRGYAILQRGSLASVVHDDAQPVPAVDSVENS